MMVLESLGLIGFMWLFALVPAGLAWREWRAWYYLRRDGIETQARIQHQWEGKLGWMSHYYVIYEFDGYTPDDQYFFFSKFTEVDIKDFRNLQQGTPPIVRYVSHKPGIFRLVNQPTEQWHWTFGTLFAAAWALFFTVVMLR